MRHGSLFSGIGGFDLAAEWMGWQNVFHCEWNKFGQRVLKYYWPNAISYDDITKTDFTIHRGSIDILTGGFPCQPYSIAGKRKGKEDDRHLWPEMLRAIREIQPRYVVGENVRGIISWNGGMVFDEVQIDLENQGYEILPFLLPAAGVGSPQKRYRTLFVARSMFTGREVWEKPEKGQQYGRGRNTRSEFASLGLCGTTTNSCLPGRQEGGDYCRREIEKQIEEGAGLRNHIGAINETRNVTNPNSEGIKRCENPREFVDVGSDIDKLSGGYNKPGNWDEFPTVSPVCVGNDGLSNKLDGITFSKWRNESIKAGGNAVVPQVVFQIFKAIEQYELQRK